jgi:hypothetical protein
MKQTNLLPSRAALLTALCHYSLAAQAQDATWRAAPCCVYTLSELRILLEHHRRTPLSVHELLTN